ncbi:MAG: HEAT repeat domain-containing protein [Cyanobacteria bacterium P01_A01_bin.84]
MQHLQNPQKIQKLQKIFLPKLMPVTMGLLLLTMTGCGVSRVKKLETEKNVTQLVTILQENSYSSDEAATALGNIGDKQAVEPLILALKSGKGKVAARAAIALGKIKDNRAVKPLMTAVNTGNYIVRPAAQRGLGQIVAENPQLMKSLLPKLNELNSPMTGVFGKAGDKAVDPLIVKLTDVSVFARANAAKALGEIGNTKAITPLTKNLTDWGSNIYVAQALTKLNWQPETDEDKIHFLVANQKGEELRENWDTTKKVLLKDIQSKNYRKITNGLYAFISLGDKDIISTLVTVLNNKGSKNMALAYLNSKESTLEGAAKEWARKRGYKIIRKVRNPSAQTVKWGGW